MTDQTVLRFSGDAVAEAYERLLVPRIFAVWAEALLDTVDLREGEAVLDIACGPGSVAKAAARRVGPGGFVVGTDASLEMLAVARDTTPASARVRYELALAESQPFDDARFDAVTCQQGLQFFPDRGAALREIRRVLRPGGRAAIATWQSIETAAYFGVVRAAIASEFPEEARSCDVPFSFPDDATLRREIEAEGFEVVVGSLELPLEFDDIEQAVEAMAATPFWASVAERPLRSRTAMLDAARVGFAGYLHHGRVVTSMRSNVAIARRPQR